MFLARLAARHPWPVLVLFVLSTAIAAVGAARVHQTDDLLEFIPPDDPDIKIFRAVNRAFGSLKVALVGVEAVPGDDVFAPETIRRITAISEAVRAVAGVDGVVSLTSMVDFVPSDDAVQIVQLVKEPPVDAAARKALRERVMSLEHVVGNFVTRDGTASMVLVFLAEGGSDRKVAGAIRAAVERERGGLRATYGGAPFATAAIFDEMNRDQGLLTPLAVLVILAVILLTFRDPVGVVLTIATVAWAALVVLGGMGFMNEPFTVASATLPVILFASGSSYAVHLLGRYYGLPGPDPAFPKNKANSDARLLEAARIVGPPVAVAGLTTSAGFFSFLVMDIHPMRAFGLECALGGRVTLLASMTLVPAVIALLPRGQFQPASTGRVGELLASFGAWAHRNRVKVCLGAALLGLATVGPMLRLEVRMEPRTFFRKGSDPWNSEQFLVDRFGGSNFLQVAVKGDLTDPATLHEVQRLEQFARSLPGVTQAASIVGPIKLVNNAMGGGKRLPDTTAQVKELYFFTEGEPSLKRLMTPDHDQALVQIRIRGSDATLIVEKIEDYVAHRMRMQPEAPTAAIVVERLQWIATAAGARLEASVAEKAVAAAHLPPVGDARLVEARRAILESVLKGEGGTPTPAHLDDERRADRVEKTVASGQFQVAPLYGSAEEAESGQIAFEVRAHAKARDLAVDEAAPLLGALPPAAAQDARDALADLFPFKAIAKAPRAIQVELAGEPILDRGLSRSVARNQARSLLVSIVAVLLLMGILFRSGYLAVLSMTPAMLTMAALFGGMSLAGMRVDIGTSLVASIATGAGSDFAMHYLWYLKRAAPSEVVKFVGPIMVISALLIAAGFGILAAGQSQPMRLFGTLAALSMAGAAFLTFLLVPALLRKVDTRMEGDDGASQSSSVVKPGKQGAP